MSKYEWTTVGWTTADTGVEPVLEVWGGVSVLRPSIGVELMPELVKFPTRITKKVLIAFIEGDDEDEVIWAEKLLVKDVIINTDEYGGSMTIETALYK